MFFCQSCGKELEDDASFCSKCGRKINEKEKSREDERTQTFIGEIRKCPSCGIDVPSMTAVCPECGHEFIKASASNILKEFQEGMLKYSWQKKRDFIATFPIPNTKEDLGNFLSMIASILLTELCNPKSRDINTYRSKFNEIMTKIEMLIPVEDSVYKQAKIWEERINGQIEKNIKDYKKVISSTIGILVTLGLIGIFIALGLTAE